MSAGKNVTGGHEPDKVCDAEARLAGALTVLDTRTNSPPDDDLTALAEEFVDTGERRGPVWALEAMEVLELQRPGLRERVAWLCAHRRGDAGVYRDAAKVHARARDRVYGTPFESLVRQRMAANFSTWAARLLRGERWGPLLGDLNRGVRTSDRSESEELRLRAASVMCELVSKKLPDPTGDIPAGVRDDIHTFRDTLTDALERDIRRESRRPDGAAASAAVDLHEDACAVARKVEVSDDLERLNCRLSPKLKKALAVFTDVVREEGLSDRGDGGLHPYYTESARRLSVTPPTAKAWWKEIVDIARHN